MKPQRLGPYVISRSLGKGIYELKNQKGVVLKKKANINRLTVFKRRTPSTASDPPPTSSSDPPTTASNPPPTTVTASDPPPTSSSTVPAAATGKKRLLPSSRQKGRQQKRRVVVNTDDEDTWRKIGDVRLTEKDRDDLLGANWLNGRVIEASQILLKQAYDHIGGLQTPLLGQTLQFDIVTASMVQILHSGGNHWLTVSTVDVDSPATVRVFDSLSSPLPEHTKQQIAAILNTSEPQIKIEFANVQTQPNLRDCGLFAVANALAICAGQSPENLLFDVKSMRGHLAKCLGNGKLQPFPARQRRTPRSRRQTEFLLIYCSCRQIESRGDEMIACDKCGEWFHRACHSVPIADWNDAYFHWTCPCC